MIFQTYIPKSPLNQFVDCFIFHDGFQPPHSIDRFLPDGNVEIIIDLDDKPKFIYDNETLKEIQSVSQVWASGVRTEPISIPSAKDASMMIISFKRGMAYPFFPFPMNEITDCVLDADLIWGNKFALIREQIATNKFSAKKFQIVENFLCRNFISTLIRNPCVEFALQQIIHQPQQIKLSQLTQKIGYSQKHFIKLFNDQVGITPKSYLKIMRFQKAVTEIEKFSEIDWLSISNDCGFYDQAHFINDFKTFSGFTPEEYFYRTSDFLNYIPVR
ncbi:MAG TPA: AraC family transcriptional regulator [Pyrinomonadaceae bacterium]|nr:AraC family transcriptional regulator [Pyrinomonadaceae bacterium]